MLSGTGSEILIWLFVINLGIAFGAGLYEHRIVLPRWIFFAKKSVGRWNAAAANLDDTGRKFWAFVTTMPLTLLTLVSLFAAWNSSETVRGWWLAAGFVALADRVFTFSYFIPTMVRLMAAEDSTESLAVAKQWWNFNYFRHAIVLTAWLLSLKTFAMFYQQKG